MQKISDTSDMQSVILKQIMIKTVGQRDYPMQELMHHLLSLKCVSATHEVVTASLLDSSRRIQMARNEEFCTTPSRFNLDLIYILCSPQQLAPITVAPFFTLPTMILNRRQTTTPGTTCPTLSDKCVGSFTSHRIIDIEGL